jgi:hypothetical protein
MLTTAFSCEPSRKSTRKKCQIFRRLRDNQNVRFSADFLPNFPGDPGHPCRRRRRLRHLATGNTNLRNMDAGTSFCIGLQLAQNFSRYRCRLALPEKNVLEDIAERVPFSPAKKGVWILARAISQRHQNRSYCIGNRRAAASQYPVAIHRTGSICRLAEQALCDKG